MHGRNILLQNNNYHDRFKKGFFLELLSNVLRKCDVAGLSVSPSRNVLLRSNNLRHSLKEVFYFEVMQYIEKDTSKKFLRQIFNRAIDYRR